MTRSSDPITTLRGVSGQAARGETSAVIFQCWPPSREAAHEATSVEQSEKNMPAAALGYQWVAPGRSV